ncbi:MAG: protein kinase [Planctomycetota bacterium]
MEAPREGHPLPPKASPAPEEFPATVRRPSDAPPGAAETPATFLGPTVLGSPVTQRSPAAASAPPERFGRYELRGQIGRGGMGTVYRAFDTQLKREVALKLLRVQDGDRAEQFLRFRREAEAAARLRHPNLVVTYDLGAEGEHHYLTMELVEGGSFARHLASQGGRLPPHEAMRFVRDVALGLACAHESGIVHRDLKPENILLEKYEGTLRPKISDFGLARAVSETGDARLTVTGSIIGTPSYMAPEQAEGRLELVDARSDVYALGVVLYEAVCGKVPYPGTDPMSVILKKLSEEPSRPRVVHPGIARDVETIIEKAMARERDRRYATARELAEDLDRCLKGEAILARPESGIESAWRLIRRRRGLVAAVALIAVLLAVAGGAAWSSRVARREQARLQAEALQNLRKIAESSQAASLALRRAGLPLSEQKRFLDLVDEAARYAMKQAPTLAEPHYRLGRLYRAQLRFDDALAEQERALAKEPDYAPARFERALLDLRRWESRLAALRAEWTRDEGRRLAESGQLERAGMGETVLATPPADADLAGKDAEAGRLRDRIAEDLVKVEALMPGSAEASCLRGLVQLHAREEEGAARVRKALESDPTMEEAYEGLARAARARPDFEEAARVYARGIEADKGYVPFWLGRAELAAAEADRAAMSGGNPVEAWQRAEADLTRALELDPASRQGLLRRGTVRSRFADRLGDDGKDPEPKFKDAFADLTAAGETAEALLMRGKLQDMWGYWMMDHALDPGERYAAAVADLDRAIRSDPLSAAAWWGRANVRRHWGLFMKNHGDDPKAIYQDAVADYARALELDPRCADLWRSRAEVRLALAVYGNKRGERVYAGLDDACKDLEKAIHFEPASSWSVGSRAQVYMFRGECLVLDGDDPTEAYGKAIADLDMVLKKDSNPTNFACRATCRIVCGEVVVQRGGDATALLAAARADLEAAHPDSARHYFVCFVVARLELACSWQARNTGADPFPFLKRARAACEEALRLNSASTETLCWLGMIGRHEGLCRADRGEDPEPAWSAARADFDRALAVTKTWEWVWLQRGLLGLSRAERTPAPDAFASAAADFEQVLRVNPGFVFGLAALGETKRRWAEHEPKDAPERFRSALVDLDLAVERGPNHPGARLERARVRLALGDGPGAEADLQQVLKVAPAWRDEVAPLLERAKRR